MRKKLEANYKLLSPAQVEKKNVPAQDEIKINHSNSDDSKEKNCMLKMIEREVSKEEESTHGTNYRKERQSIVQAMSDYFNNVENSV